MQQLLVQWIKDFERNCSVVAGNVSPAGSLGIPLLDMRSLVLRVQHYREFKTGIRNGKLDVIGARLLNGIRKPWVGIDVEHAPDFVVFQEFVSLTVGISLRVLFHGGDVLHESSWHRPTMSQANPGHRFFPTLRAVVARLCRGLNSLDRHPEVVQAITGFDWIKTVCATLN